MNKKTLFTLLTLSIIASNLTERMNAGQPYKWEVLRAKFLYIANKYNETDNSILTCFTKKEFPNREYLDDKGLLIICRKIKENSQHVFIELEKVFYSLADLFKMVFIQELPNASTKDSAQEIIESFINIIKKYINIIKKYILEIRSEIKPEPKTISLNKNDKKAYKLFLQYLTKIITGLEELKKMIKKSV